MLVAKDVSKLLIGLPKGAWVALSNDEERLLACAAELSEAIRVAKAAGEPDPVVMRVPESDSPLALL
jgi:hypothetical protein